MGFYAVVLVACAVLFVASWRRSGRQMTRYVMYTGAPVVWLLLGLSAFAAVTTELFSRDGETARGIFTGGLIGTAFVQVVLLRRRGLHDAGSHGTASDGTDSDGTDE